MGDPRKGRYVAFAMTAILAAQFELPIADAAEPANSDVRRTTETPIEHVIVIIGENRTFDNVYGTYVPKRGQTVSNLLSKGIVRSDGSPGANASLAAQSRIATIDPPSYFISTDKLNNPQKTAYPLLPTPETGSAPPRPVTLEQLRRKPVPAIPPFDPRTFSRDQIHALSPFRASRDLLLLTTGATGFKSCAKDPADPPTPCPGPDTRVSNYAALPNTVFPITGPALPYDSYAGDMVHRFFHMWQQSDCDGFHASPSNPAGCRNDLYPFVGIARGDDSGSNSMGFYDVGRGDAPLFRRLADTYTMSDNYHQPTMGGTGVQHTMLGTADSIFWEPAEGFPSEPPEAQVANPNPKAQTDPGFVRDSRWTKCADPAQPGVGPILSYLSVLPWRPDRTASNCQPGRFYAINNTPPGFLSNGKVNAEAIRAGTAVPPSSLRTIGDALNEKGLSWAYYGGGFNAAVRLADGSQDPFDVMIGTGGAWYCDICNPFQYATSIMGDRAQRSAHLKDAVDLLADMDHGRLPAVSYLKPDSFDDGHPAELEAQFVRSVRAAGSRRARGASGPLRSDRRLRHLR